MSTTPRIGSIEFASLDWQDQPVGCQDEKWADVGVDGWAFREDANRPDPSQALTFADFPDASARESAYEAYKATQGTFVTIIKPDGTSRANVHVDSVQKIESRSYALADGGLQSGKFGLRCRWILQETDTT